MLKSRKIYRILIPIFVMSSIIGIPLSFSYMAVKASQVNREGDTRFFKNSLFMDMHSSISSDPILIKMKDFTYEESLEVKKAVSQIDELSDNLNYIYENDSKGKPIRVIYINNNVELPNTIGGTTKYKADDLSAEILYPIEINIREGLINYVYSEDHSKTLLASVITHEMMHTLGFSDLRTEKWLGQSIMYYNLSDSSDHGVAGLTEQDKKDIISVYGESEDLENI